MDKTNYRHVIDEAIEETDALSRKRNEIDARLLCLRQLIYAALNMLPESDRSLYQAELTAMASQLGNLTDSVREALKLATQRDSSWTAAEVRDYLKNSGFDFSQYSSNPLASISTVLKRFKPGEVEGGSRDGVATFRWANPFPDRTGKGRNKP